MTVIVVTGIPGVGSSTVVEEALKLKGGEPGFVCINYGDVMLEVAKEEELVVVAKRDEIRKLGSDEQHRIQMLAANNISHQAKKSNVILDTHCTIKTPLGYLPGLPEYVLKELKLDQFVLIEASPEEIFNRRYKDKSRERDVEGEKSIEEHQMMNRAMAMAYACLTGACVKIIENHDDAVKQAAEKFLKLL
jgi:adenylate kinase